MGEYAQWQEAVTYAAADWAPDGNFYTLVPNFYALDPNHTFYPNYKYPADHPMSRTSRK